MAALGVHVEAEHALTIGADAEVFELAALEVIGEQVPTGITRVTCGWDAHRLFAFDNAVNADVSCEIEFAIRLDEIHVALALWDGFAAFLAAGLGQIAQFLCLVAPGVEAKHLRALI